MRAWCVISEILSEVVPLLDDGTGPSEHFSIVEVVFARTRARARRLALREYMERHGYELRESPRTRTKVLGRVSDGEPERVVTHELRWEWLIEHPILDGWGAWSWR
jgi:hypothetical protein